MGCISANIGTNGHCLTAKISRIGRGLKANIGLADVRLVATISRVGSGLKANIGLVCTPNTEVYLRVTPDVLWFFQAETLDVEVASNIKWIVK